MTTPQRPWERQPVNQRQPLQQPGDINQYISGTPGQAGFVGGGGGGGAQSNSSVLSRPPPLPPRPNSGGHDTGMSSMGSYGGYGSTYGGYGSSYGGYSSPYGGMGGYGRFGGMGGMYGAGMSPYQQDQSGFLQEAEASSRQAFQSLESVVHAFGSISMMLESSYHAVYSSFRAVLGVAEHFSRMKSHFTQIFSALAVVRTLRWLYQKLLYLIGLRRQDPSTEAAWRAAACAAAEETAGLTEADLKASKSSWPIVMFLAVVFGGPYLIWRLLSSISSKEKPNSANWAKGQGPHYSAKCLYSFNASSQNELSFCGGQVLFLAPKEQQPAVKGWLLASDGKRRGLVPANYIRIEKSQAGSSRSLQRAVVSSNPTNRTDQSVQPQHHQPQHHQSQHQQPAGVHDCSSMIPSQDSPQQQPHLFDGLSSFSHQEQNRTTGFYPQEQQQQQLERLTSGISAMPPPVSSRKSLESVSENPLNQGVSPQDIARVADGSSNAFDIGAAPTNESSNVSTPPESKKEQPREDLQ